MRLHRFHRSAVLAVGASLAIATAISADAATTKNVSIKGFQFQPKVVSAPMGGAVRWANNDAVRHTTTSKIIGAVGWNSSLNPRASFQKTLTASGTYGYVCTIHFGMSGTVAVPPALALASGKINVKVATVAAPAGYSYQAEVKIPGSSKWTKLPATTRPSVLYSPPKRGTYSFRSSVKHGGAAGTAPSPAKTVTVG
jgi:plastocyanin